MKWVKRLGLGMLALATLALVTIYAGGEWVLNRHYEPVPNNVLLSSRPDVLAKGERLSRLYGCHEACHGKDMEGAVFFDEPWLARLVAPNLTRAAEQYTPVELEAIVRQGILPNGRSVTAMPSASFSYLTDSDLAAILSFIRAYPKNDQDLGPSSYRLMARFGLLAGWFSPAAQTLHEQSGDTQPADKSSMGRGEYLAMTACSECHGMDLNGDFGPDLAVVKAYSPEDFATLMTTGLGIGERELGVMTEVSRGRFVHLTAEETADLFGFLQSR